jgi:hypothetical protein
MSAQVLQIFLGKEYLAAVEEKKLGVLTPHKPPKHSTIYLFFRYVPI